MSQRETDILTEAGLSADQARYVVACYTMASALAAIHEQQQQQQQPPTAAPLDVLDEGGDAP